MVVSCRLRVIVNIDSGLLMDAGYSRAAPWPKVTIKEIKGYYTSRDSIDWTVER